MNTPASGLVREYERLNIRHEVETASPHRLILLMMDRVLAKIALAKVHMERGEVNHKGEQISDAIGIIGGLQVSLNHEPDAKLGRNFDALYDYMSRRLLQSNFKNDTGGLNEVMGLMGEIKSAWEVVGEQLPQSEQLPLASK